MRREALTLVFLMFAGVFQMAACDFREDKNVVVTPSPAATAPVTQANLGAPSAAEQKDGATPVQGHVDPKQPEQKRDFEQKKQ